MNFEINASNWERPQLFHENYAYRREKTNKNDPDTEYWICVRDKRSGCRARGITRGGRETFDRTRSHSHPPDPTEMETKMVHRGVKRKAEEAIERATTSDIYHQAIAQASEAVLATMPSAKSVKRNIQRQRSQAQAPLVLPAPRNAIEIPQEFAHTSDEANAQPFLHWDSGPSDEADNQRILLFASDDGLHFLATCTAITLDGTFKNSPPMFEQLFMVLGSRSNISVGRRVVSLWALLPNKEESTYRRLFAKIRDILPGWAPNSIVVDLERASINAAQSTWPNSTVTVSFFHLSKNYWKKIQECGLAAFYGESDDDATRMKSVLALALVSPADVADAFDNLMDLLQPWKATKPENIQHALEDVFDYFEVNYVGRVRGGSRQAPRIASIELWNVRQRTLEDQKRTNNDAEETHLKLGNALEPQAPNLWKFLKVLQGLEADSRKQIAEIRADPVERKRKQRPEWEKASQRMRNAAANYDVDTLDLYLLACTRNFEISDASALRSKML